MYKFENASPPKQVEEKFIQLCSECTEELECKEFIVCCTGTDYSHCDKCSKKTRSYYVVRELAAKKRHEHVLRIFRGS